MNEKKYKQALDLLNIHFGHSQLRLGQDKAIESILDGQDTLIIMPTGGGKSLCYQLPALVLDGITIVVSPLIALMKDQVDSLQAIGVPANFINSSISPAETFKRLEETKNNFYKLLYVAPERFYNQEFLNTLSKIKISLFAIDEAHCISHWGHDFRPSYLQLGQVVKNLGRPPLVALTATATPEVKNDIAKQLELQKPSMIITGFKRPNLEFGAIQINASLKTGAVLDAVNNVSSGSGIIYVGTRAKVEDVLSVLLSHGHEAAAYHAGMDGESRRWTQENFMNGKIKIIVATNAFGMGIDKSNIRFVIHYDLPGTIEAYYQEAGRAGRDGKPSFCLLLFSPADRHLREFFIRGDNPSPRLIRNIYDRLTEFESDTILITYAQLKDILAEDVPEMAIGTSIKLLERHGYIRKEKENNNAAFFRLKEKPEKIFDMIGTRAKVQLRIFDKLIKHFITEMEKGWKINFEELAGTIEEKKDSIVRLAKKLNEMELAEYQPPFKGTELKIIKRVNKNDLELDFNALSEKLSQAYAKLDKMEEYARYRACRQNFILNYFGESNPAPCGRCDNCVNKGPAINLYSKKYDCKTNYSFKKKKSNSETELEIKAPQKNPPLSTKLTQLETLDLFNKKFNVNQIAKKREIEITTVINHLCFLIEKKLIKNIDSLVETKKQISIEKTIKKINTDKLTPIKEVLGDNYSWDEIKIVLAKTKQSA